MAPGGIRTHDLSRRAAADLRLRPRGHWDRPIFMRYIDFIFHGVSSIVKIFMMSECVVVMEWNGDRSEAVHVLCTNCD